MMNRWSFSVAKTRQTTQTVATDRTGRFCGESDARASGDLPRWGYDDLKDRNDRPAPG